MADQNTSALFALVVWRALQRGCCVLQVLQAGGGNHTLSAAVEIYRGSNSASIRRKNHNQLDVHGLGKEYRSALLTITLTSIQK